MYRVDPEPSNAAAGVFRERNNVVSYRSSGHGHPPEVKFSHVVACRARDAEVTHRHRKNVFCVSVCSSYTNEY